VTQPLPSPLFAAPGAGVPDAAPARLQEWFDPAALGRNRRYRAGGWALAVSGMATGIAWTATIALSGARWRPVVSRLVGGRSLPAACLFGAGLAVSGEVVRLPLAVASYGWGRGHGLVTQPVGSWLSDRGKAAGLGAGLSGALAVATAATMRHSPRTWWLATWGVISVGTVALTLAGPKLIEPLFQRTRALDDPELEHDVRQVAATIGVPVREVVLNDASTRTTASNAYVSGLGPTRRMVLFDTLVRDFPRDQVRFVVAHELAHVARRHILRGSLISAAACLPALAAVGGVVATVTGTRRIGSRDADLTLRRLTVAAVGVGVLGALAGRLGLKMSRGFEREADWEALRATDDPDAAIELQRGLITKNLGVPDPPGWVQRMWGSHPTALERIGLALHSRS
jgi:STE24 endopeptidase